MLADRKFYIMRIEKFVLNNLMIFRFYKDSQLSLIIFIKFQNFNQ